MINTAYKHEELFISEIKDKIYKTTKPGLNINIFRLYVLQYLMLLEDQLSPNRNKYLSEITSLEGAKIVKDVRMKCWNLLIHWSIYPIDLDQHIKDMSNTLEILRDHRRNKPALLDKLSEELSAYTSNLTLKNQRLVKSYSNYYYTVIKRSGTKEYLSLSEARIPSSILQELSKENTEYYARPTTTAKWSQSSNNPWIDMQQQNIITLVPRVKSEIKQPEKKILQIEGKIKRYRLVERVKK